eukprot:scaffold20180_cov116-Isochrysis_galbana.AAC.3
MVRVPAAAASPALPERRLEDSHISRSSRVAAVTRASARAACFRMRANVTSCMLSGAAVLPCMWLWRLLV